MLTDQDPSHGKLWCSLHQGKSSENFKLYSCFVFLLKLLLLSNCRSNPTLSHSFSGTKHGVLPGHPDSTEVPNQGIINNDEKLLIPPNSQGIAIGKQPIIGNMRPKKNDLRYRYTI